MGVGLMLIASTRAGNAVSTAHWVAAGAIVALEGYLLFGFQPG